MKTLLTLLLALAGPLSAQMVLAIPGGTAAPAAAPSYLVHETFEGSASCGFGSYTNCDTTPFYGQNAIANYVTAPAPLQGAKSLEFAAENGQFVETYTASNEIYVSTEWAFSSFPISENMLLEIRNSSNTILCTALIYGNSYIYTGGSGTRQYADNNTVTFSTATKYYAKLRAKIGTGANAICQVWYSMDGTSWTGSPATTDATFTTQPSRLTLEGTAAVTSVWDDIRASTSDITYP